MKERPHKDTSARFARACVCVCVVIAQEICRGPLSAFAFLWKQTGKTHRFMDKNVKYYLYDGVSLI